MWPAFVYLAEKENLLYEVREREWLLSETTSDLLLAASENKMLKAQLEKGKTYTISKCTI